MSGGRSTVAMKTGKGKLGAQAGDISSIDAAGHAFIEKYMIECKAYRSLNFESMIKGKGFLVDFWNKAVEEAVTYGKKPMLVGKQNNYPIITCLDSAGVDDLKVRPLLRVRLYEEDMHILFWDDFLKHKPNKRRVRL